MIRKIVSFLILVPLALVLVALSVANKDLVTVSGKPQTTRLTRSVTSRPLITTLRKVHSPFSNMMLVVFAALASFDRWRGRSTAGPSH